MPSRRTQKVALILTNEIFFRHYIQTGALEETAKNYDLTIIAEKQLQSLLEEHIVRQKIKYFEYPDHLDRQIRLVNELSLFANIDKCKDFAFRIKRKYNSSPHKADGSLFTNPRFLRLKVFIKKLLYYFLAIQPVRKLINRTTKRWIERKSPLRHLIREGNFDVVLCPSNAGGSIDTDIAAMTGTSGQSTKTVLLIDNWDNLSSKYVMPYHPNLVVVWGEQTKFHAISIQNLKPKQVMALGTPRFSFYFNTTSNDAKNEKTFQIIRKSMPKKYALFLGSQTFWDENSTLKKIRSILETKFPDLQLVYRPHPWRETFGKKINSDHKVMIDPTLDYLSHKTSGFSLPNLSLYRSLLENSEFLIGGCTSMIIEASILRKKYLLMAHDDGNPLQSPYEYFTKCEHQNMTSALNNVCICYSEAELEASLNDLMTLKVPSTDPVLRHIISSKSQDYSSHLATAIQDLATSSL